MCGIAGIIGRLGPDNRAALKRMQGAMSHRGPDGEGIWEAEPDAQGFGPMLAHRRLSIIDISSAGAQPMKDVATTDVLVINGEIYNYAELRSSLGADGRALQSSGDTAVVLRLLGLQGNDAIAKLRGMFAFAFWDQSERKLTLARDPFGIKPLYVAYNRDPDGEWRVLFASELRSMLASGLLGDVRLNPDAVASVAWSGFLVSPATAVAGVESLMAGQYRVFDAAGRERGRAEFWSASEAANRSRLRERDVAEVLKECVRKHLVSDVPLGIFLSGGVDSSAIANLAQRHSDQRIHTYTLVLQEAELNEGGYARQIANAIGTQHHEVLLTEQFFVDQLETSLDSLDQPSFDGLNSYFMSQAVRQAGLKVALVGSGGDELFGGYNTFRDLPRIFEWSGWTKRFFPTLRANFLRGFCALKQGRNGAFPPQTRWAKLPEMVTQGENLLALYQLAYALFLPESQALLLGDVARHSNLVDGLPEAMRTRLGKEIAGRSPLSAISTMEQRLFLGERCLRDIDATSMAASIEVRVPFVDQVLHDAVDRLSDEDRYQPVRTKSLLRRIGLTGLDPALFDRPKAGFELPIERWLRSDLGRQVDATLRDASLVAPTGLNPEAVARLWDAFLDGAPGLYWTRIWALYVLIRWCYRHRVYL